METKAMTDDKTKKRPQDASRINIHEPYEVNYWISVLNCTKAELIYAVGKIGTSAEKVKAFLKK